MFFSEREKIQLWTITVRRNRTIHPSRTKGIFFMKDEPKNTNDHILKNKRSHREKRNAHLENVFYHTRPESASDCTGYTPVIPLSAEESESYEDLMDLPAPARYRWHNENE